MELQLELEAEGTREQLAELLMNAARELLFGETTGNHQLRSDSGELQGEFTLEEA